MAPVWMLVTEIVASFTTAPLWSVTRATIAELLGACPPPPPRLRRGAVALATAGAGARNEQRSRSGDRPTGMTSPVLRNDHVVFEITGAVGLGPEAHLARHGRTKDRVVRWKQIRVRRSAVA